MKVEMSQLPSPLVVGVPVAVRFAETIVHCCGWLVSFLEGGVVVKKKRETTSN